MDQTGYPVKHIAGRRVYHCTASFSAASFWAATSRTDQFGVIGIVPVSRLHGPPRHSCQNFPFAVLDTVQLLRPRMCTFPAFLLFFSPGESAILFLLEPALGNDPFLFPPHLQRSLPHIHSPPTHFSTLREPETSFG